MKSTIKMAEGIALGMIIGGAAWAMISAKMNSKPNAKTRMNRAVKSACEFIEELCS